MPTVVSIEDSETPSPESPSSRLVAKPVVIVSEANPVIVPQVFGKFRGSDRLKGICLLESEYLTNKE